MSSSVTGPKVVLIGPPGSGKSTVATELAKLLHLTVRDTDQDVETNTGKSIADLFIEEGEPAFRALEVQAVAAAISEHNGVLSLGGGAPITPATADLLETYKSTAGEVVFLDVSLANVAPRVGFNQSRPLLLGNPRAKWQELMNSRRPVYEKLASIIVSTDDISATEVAEKIAAQLKLKEQTS